MICHSDMILGARLLNQRQVPNVVKTLVINNQYEYFISVFSLRIPWVVQGPTDRATDRDDGDRLKVFCVEIFKWSDFV